jgi:hypothetical protein
MVEQSFDGSKGKRRVTSMLERSDIAELESIARQRRVSLAWVIRDAVRAYLGSDHLSAQTIRPAHPTRSDAQ